jgi:hypothetical protein
MDSDTLRNNLTRKFAAIQRDNILVQAALDTVNEYQDRIFDEGKNTSGGKIGTYSTKPTTISSENSPKKLKDNDFQPFSRSQRSKTGKKGYFGQFFPGGYKQFKSSIGRESGFVNLTLSGELRQDVTSRFIQVSGNTVILKLKKAINVKKRGFLESKYGSIFNPSKRESEFFNNRVAALLRIALNA